MTTRFSSPFLIAIIAVAVVTGLATQLAPSPLAILIPNLAYVWLFLQIDRFEKEPWWLLIGIFVWGMFSTLLGAVGQLLPAWLLGNVTSPLIATYFTRILFAPVVEELFKALPLFYLYYRKHREFDGWIDGIVYGGVAGFGFALVEQTLFSVSGDSTGALLFFERQYFISTIYFGLAHGIFSGMVGVGLGVARLSASARIRRYAPFWGLLAAIVGHGLYNGSTVIDSELLDGAVFTIPIAYGVLLVVAGAGVVYAFRFQEQLMQTYLQDELSADSYNKLGSGIWDLLTWGKRRRFIQLCGELAQRKQQRLLVDDDLEYQTEIERLRLELTKNHAS